MKLKKNLHIIAVLLTFTVLWIGCSMTSSAFDKGNYYVVLANTVNVRSAPSANASRVTGLQYGTRCYCTSTTEDWVQLMGGWVMRKYLALTDSSATPISPCTGKISANSVTVRSGPSTDTIRIGGFSTRGTEILITGKVINSVGELWYLTEYTALNSDGIPETSVGYILGDYISAVNDDSFEEKTEAVDTPETKLNTSGVPASISFKTRSKTSKTVAVESTIYVSDDSICVNEDGNYEFTVYPDDGRNFNQITKDDIQLNNDSLYRIVQIQKNNDGSITVFFTQKSTGTQMKPEALQAALNKNFVADQTGNVLTIKWGAVPEAISYNIYAAYNGKAYELIDITNDCSTTIQQLNGAALNISDTFRVYVVAKLADGKSVTSNTAYTAGASSKKYTNVKKIKTTKKSITLKLKKTASLKAKVTLKKSKKKQLGFCKKFRYASSDNNIATVSANGKIKAVGKGTCTVYVYAVNGMSASVNVKVK